MIGMGIPMNQSNKDRISFPYAASEGPTHQLWTLFRLGTA
jgi:hypothetical protein